MIKVIIKNTDGSKEVKELTDGMVIKPEPGQQFYFDNLDAKKYKFNLSDGQDSIEILFNKAGQKYTFKFEDMAKLIKESSSLTENKSVLGIINDQEGMDELNQTVLNPEFKSDNIIRELKDLLAQTDGNVNQNGIIIDDFGSLAEQLDAAAAGEATSNGSSTFFASEAVSGNTYGAEGRGTGLEFNDPDGNLVGVEGTTNRDNNLAGEPGTSTEDITATIVVGDAGTVEEADGAYLTYDVKLSNEVGEDVEVTLNTSGTATAGDDYKEQLQYSTDGGTTWVDVPATGKITLPADASAVKVRAEVLDDSITENDETVILGATTTDSQITDSSDTGLGTIEDDEAIPTITLSGNEVLEVTDGTATGNKVKGLVTATVDIASSEDLTITLSTGDTIVIKAGELTGSTEVETSRIDDAYDQGETKESVTITDISNDEIDITGKKAVITINDDNDPVDVTVTAFATSPKVIDVDTEFGDSTGVNIEVYDKNGNPGNLSVVKGTNHDGFGVYGNTSGGAANSELGYGSNGTSEKIVFDFTNDVDSLDVAFAWRNNHETAKIIFSNDGQDIGYATVSGGGNNTDATVTYYDMDGNLKKEVSAQGGTDRVDLSYTFEFPDENGNPMAFDKAEFSAPGHDDDYLIHKVSYTEVIDPEITNINTSEGKITFNIQVDEDYPPQGSAKAIVEVNGTEYEVELNATGRGTLTLDAKDFNDLSNVEIKVKDIVGGNYEDVNPSTDSFDLSGSFTDDFSSTDDSITINEDETYVLTETDFGEYGEAVKQFKITELPSEGTLYLTVHKGEILIDKEGNTYTATEDAKIEITEGQIISLANVAAGNVTYEAEANSDADTSFKFQIGDENGNFKDVDYTTDIEVIAVADAPTASIDVTRNVNEGDNGSSNSNKNEIKNTDSADNIGTTSDDKMVVDRELVMNEKIDLKEGDDTLILNKDINQVTVDLGEGNDEVIVNGKINGTNNFHLESGDDVIRINDVVTNNTHVSGGEGKDTLYLSGNQSDYTINWQTNNNGMIEGSITDKIGGGTIQYNQMETIVFGDGTYIGEEPPSQDIPTEETYTVDINAALTDLDGSESLTVTITNVPTGAEFTTTNSSYTLTNNNDGTWTVNLPEGTKDVDSSIKMTVPKGTEDIDLGITARATETRDNDDGTNYKEANDSDALVYGENESKTLDFEANTVKSDENIIIVLDVSGSMNDDVRLEDGSWTTRLALAKDALENMIDTYEQYSNIKVNLTKFSATADDLDGSGSENGWYSAEDALNIINNMSASGKTNYEDALEKTYTDYVAPANGEKATIYFISDGKPNVENDDSQSGLGEAGIIDSRYLDNWKDFLEDNAKELNVIGIGKGITNSTYLDMVAQNVGNVKTNVTIIEDENELKDKLVENVYEKVDGNILDNISGGDGEKTIDSIVVDGVTYTIADSSNNILTLQTSFGGVLEFNFETGDYSFGGLRSNIVEESEKFTVNVSDENGDTANFYVNIDITNTVDTVASAPTLSFSIEDNGSQEIEHDYSYTEHDYNYSQNFTDADDYINIEDDVESDLNTSGGDDVVNVGDNVYYGNTINLGDGDDFITIGDSINDYYGYYNAKVDGGEGNDSIYLKGYTVEDYNNNVDSIKYKISNFENIKFKDGTVWGDASVFNTSPLSSTVYSYTITLAAILGDLNSETLSQITLDNIPASVSSIKDSDGTEYTVSNGTVTLPNNVGNEHTYTFVSSESLSSSQINSMSASVTSTEQENGDTNTITENAKLEVEASDTMIGTDANEKFDSQGNSATINAGAGDDEIIYNAGDTVDGGAGEDTLKILGNDDIDLSDIKSNVNNIEEIDLTNDFINELIVDEQSIEDLTDDENILKIFGDSGDKVMLEGGADNWVNKGTETDSDGNTFNVYQGTSSATANVTVLIDDDVSIESDI